MSQRRRSRSPRQRKSRFTDQTEHNDQDLIRSMETVKNAQTSKVDRKLYAGNLPQGITESQLVDLLNTALINQKKNLYPGEPVQSAWISEDGHYAFIEFRSIEEANQGFSLNNYPILGQNLKVGRPKTYIGAEPASASDRNILMGGYTLPTISAFSNMTDINKKGPLRPTKVYLASEVVCLENIVEEEEDFDDIKAYVERVGRSLEVVEVGKNVYVEFISIEEAKFSARKLAEKTFAGKPLKISYYPWEKFKNRDFEYNEELNLIINA